MPWRVFNKRTKLYENEYEFSEPESNDLLEFLDRIEADLVIHKTNNAKFKCPECSSWSQLSRKRSPVTGVSCEHWWHSYSCPWCRSRFRSKKDVDPVSQAECIHEWHDFW